MLQNLKRINWPDSLQPVGHLVKASVIGQVKDYDHLLHIARSRAERVKQKLHEEALAQIETMRSEVGASLKSDLIALESAFVAHREQLQSKSTALCTEVTKLALDTIVAELTEEEKVKSLVQHLIGRLHSFNKILFRVSSSQKATLEAVLNSHFQHIFHEEDYLVEPDSTLEQDQIRVTSAEDAYVDISMKNLLSMVTDELDALESQLRAEFEPVHVVQVHNDTVARATTATGCGGQP